MNARAKEENLLDYSINVEPSVLEVSVRIQTRYSTEAVLDACAEWLIYTVGKRIGPIAIFGSGDIVEADCSVGLERHVLALDNIRAFSRLLPPAYPEMGRKFDDLHPLIFGSKAVCNPLSKALGTDGKLMCIEGFPLLATIRLNPQCDIAATRRRVSRWLLPTV